MDVWMTFGRAFFIGLVVAMPVGAMAVLAIERTLASGWGRGLATGAGIATADGLYASIAAFGVTALSSALETWHKPLAVVGGIALVAIGVRAVVAAGRPGTEDRDVREEGAPAEHVKVLGAYASALALTLTNPMTIVTFALVFMSAGLTAADSAMGASAATAGVAAGSLSWWVVLTGATAAVHHRAGERLRVGLSRLSGAVLVVFGVAAVALAFLG